MTSPANQTVQSKQHLPLVTYILAAGVFLMGTSEFVVAGILPEIASDLRLSIAGTGMMITVFAIGMIIGTPTVAALTLRLSRRIALSLSLIVFCAGHVIVALSDSYPIILAARFLTALATGGFWAVSAVVAAQSAGKEMGTRAVGVVLGGGMVANVIGVPLGSFAGQSIGWRGPFWALAVLSFIAAFVIYRMIPQDRPTANPPSLKAEITALKDRRVLLILVCCVFVNGAVMTVYSFISPLLTDNAGLPNSTVPLVLVAYGVGAAVGSYVGGRIGDTRPLLLLFSSAGATLLIILALAFLSHVAVPTIVLVALLGLFGMSMNPVLIGMSVGYAKDAPTPSSAMCTAILNAGTAIGTAFADYAITTPLGATGPVVVGAVCAALYFIPLLALTRTPNI